MGHSSDAMTPRYTGVSLADKHAAIAKLLPTREES